MILQILPSTAKLSMMDDRYMISSEIFSMVTSCLTELTTFKKLATPNKLYN